MAIVLDHYGQTSFGLRRQMIIWFGGVRGIRSRQFVDVLGGRDVDVDDLTENSDSSEDGLKRTLLHLMRSVGNVRDGIIFVPVTI